MEKMEGYVVPILKMFFYVNEKFQNVLKVLKDFLIILQLTEKVNNVALFGCSEKQKLDYLKEAGPKAEA